MDVTPSGRVMERRLVQLTKQLRGTSLADAGQLTSDSMRQLRKASISTSVSEGGR